MEERRPGNEKPEGFFEGKALRRLHGPQGVSGCSWLVLFATIIMIVGALLFAAITFLVTQFFPGYHRNRAAAPR
jgi:hypothetical protein